MDEIEPALERIKNIVIGSPEVREVLQMIVKEIPNIDGWCTPNRAVEFCHFVMEFKCETTVCIGVFGGRDTFALAAGHRHNGTGMTIAIDPWAAPASVEGQGAADAKWWGELDHEAIFRQFQAKKEELNLQDWIDVRRQKACEVEPPKEIGLLIVDGNHGPESIVDVERFAPNVVKGGIVYLDDLGWSGGNVGKAAERLVQIGFTKMHDRDGGAFFRRV